MDEHNNNDYSVYVIFTREVVPESAVIDVLLANTSNQTDVLYCRSCYDGNNEQTNRYICCIRKCLYDHLIEKCNFKRDEEFNITRYRVNNEPLTNGMTYGFFIRCSLEEEKTIRSIFERFESNGFLKTGSYCINTPTPYPNGTPRGYVIISFQKNGDRYPKQYIRKLKALLNNSVFNNRRLHVNWVSNSVLRDVISAESKEKKIRPS